MHRTNQLNQLNQLTGFFNNFDEDMIKNTANFKIKKFLRDNLVNEGFEYDLANKISLNAEINVEDQVYNNFYEKIEKLVSVMASAISKIYRVYKEEFDIDDEKFVEISKDFNLELTN